MFAPDIQQERFNATVALETDLAVMCGILNATHGQIVVAMAKALDQDLWQGWAIHSPAQWLAWQSGLSPSHAQQAVKLAKRAGELPCVIAALVAGELSLDQATVIALHVPAEFDEDVTALARMCTVEQLRRTLPRYNFAGQLADAAKAAALAAAAEARATAEAAGQPASAPAPEPAPTPEPLPVIEERRDFAMGTNETGWWLNGHLPLDQGAIVERALRTTQEDLYRRAVRDLPADAPHPQISLVDALINIAERALQTGQAAHPNSDRYIIYAHLEAGPNPHTGNLASLHLGPTLPEHLKHLHTCDATLRPVLETNGTPTNVGRDHRIVAQRIRRLIEQRAGGCQTPGCNRTHNLQIHHLIHWEIGGKTDTNNLIALCATHHRAHHTGHLNITGNPNQAAGHPEALHFSDKWNRTLPPAPPPISPTPSTPRPTGTYHHPLGERLDPTAIVFHPKPPK